MEIVPLGETAFILRGLPLSAAVVARGLNHRGLTGLLEAVPAFESVGLVVDPESFSADTLAELDFTEFADFGLGVLHRIPVLYHGEDLAEAASRLRVEPRQLVSLHSAQPYECKAIGFCPGFPYLGPLPPTLAALPRRSSPRPRVPAGSVAIAAGQTGIYPSAHPGGWWLIGQTPLVIADETTGHFPIEAGDQVQFDPINEAEFEALQGKLLRRPSAQN